ncbi:hypothetical protein T4D_4113 [Trichinella pseudospiralis]|uniref:Uncharacterized protein n=1 Tax=Trichinella pseudospiralis TaxID=6337 RepID=A0A0V1FQG5_TRIPS|nr:hypothetical protein T4D_4113 [Trichinella pseudospiralis]
MARPVDAWLRRFNADQHDKKQLAHGKRPSTPDQMVNLSEVATISGFLVFNSGSGSVHGMAHSVQ